MKTHPTPMPEALAVTFEQLSSDTVWLHARWILYRQLFGTNERRVELLNRVAPYFFHEVQQILADDCLLALCRLTDRLSTGCQPNLVLESLVSLVDPCQHGDLRRALDDKLKLVVERVAPFRLSRNKRIAHRDRSVALGPSTSPLPGLSRDKFEDALAAIRDFLNEIEGFFNDSEMAYQEVFAASDGEALIHALKQTVECARLEASGVLPRGWLVRSEFHDA